MKEWATLIYLRNEKNLVEYLKINVLILYLAFPTNPQNSPDICNYPKFKYFRKMQPITPNYNELGSSTGFKKRGLMRPNSSAGFKDRDFLRSIDISQS
jgi:hypothetical protein